MSEEKTQRRETRAPLRIGWLNWPWLLFLLIGSFPFVARLGMDLTTLEREAVLAVYRSWRYSPQGREIAGGSEILFSDANVTDGFGHHFKSQLQRDFRVVPFGRSPRVQVWFERGKKLAARIEVRDAEGKLQSEWFGRGSKLSNGILVGPWVGLALFVLGMPIWTSLAASLFLMLLWQADGSPLNIPTVMVDYFRPFVQEMFYRIRAVDWNASELGRLPILGAFLFLLPRFLMQVWASWAPSRKTLKYQVDNPLVSPARARYFLLLSFLLEPVAVWSGSLFGQWSADAAWWKVYLGSFAFRFVTLGTVALGIFEPGSLASGAGLPVFRKPWRERWLVAAVPILFLVANGWSWLTSLLASSYGDTLFRMKVFAIGWLIGLSLGSRIFSLWLVTLALAIAVPPTRGHWNAAVLLAFALDGALLGWWCSPFKGLRVGQVFRLSPERTLAIVGLTWIMGVFLASVGVPMGICWLGILATVWAITQAWSGPAENASVPS